MFEDNNEETPMIDEASAMAMIVSFDKDIEKAEDLDKLFKVKSFQSLIMDSYLKDEAVRLTSLLAVSAQGDRPRIIDDLYAISSFSAYLSSIEQRANSAIQNKAAIQEALVEMRTEPEGVE